MVGSAHPTLLLRSEIKKDGVNGEPIPTDLNPDGQ
jgi:hypothetical protein